MIIRDILAISFILYIRSIQLGAEHLHNDTLYYYSCIIAIQMTTTYIKRRPPNKAKGGCFPIN